MTLTPAQRAFYDIVDAQKCDKMDSASTSPGSRALAGGVDGAPESAATFTAAPARNVESPQVEPDVGRPSVIDDLRRAGIVLNDLQDLAESSAGGAQSGSNPSASACSKEEDLAACDDEVSQNKPPV